MTSAASETNVTTNLRESNRTASHETVEEAVSSDGYTHRFRRWVPNGMPVGEVFALHGIQSHSGWYGRTATCLADAGWVVNWLDRRGSGLNTDQRGDAPHAERLIHDIVQMAQHTQRAWPITKRMPKILLGVCWGGKLALATVRRYPKRFDGVVLLCPGLQTRIRIRTWQRWVLHMGMACGQQRRAVRIPLNDPRLFTGSTHWQEFIRTDKLTLRTGTIGLLNCSVQLDEMLRPIRDSRDEDDQNADNRRKNDRRATPRLSLPTFCALAGRDRIVDNAASRELLASHIVESAITTLEYPEAAHTLEFEPDPGPFLADLTHWLGQHVPETIGTENGQTA